MGGIYVFHAHESAPVFKALRQAGGPDGKSYKRLTYTFLLHSKQKFFNDTATTEIYTLSLHDALPDLVVGKRQSTMIKP